MRRSSFFLLLPLFLLFSAAESSAQFSFTALEGISAAREMAVDSLGSDAELVTIATLGELDFQGFTLSFSLTTGEAMAWVYVFRSESSGELQSVAVIRIFGFQTFGA